MRPLLPVGAWILWILVWQAASAFVGSEILLPPPLATLRALLNLLVQPDFWQVVGFTAGRILAGFVLASLSGLLLAVLSARSPLMRQLLAPPFSIIKATPVAAFTILALVWISSRNLSVLISYLMVLPVMYANLLQGILSVDQKLLEMAQVFGVSTRRRLLYIYLPDVMPHLISAASVSLGLCWKSGVAAEVIGQYRGSVGGRLYQTKLFLNTPELFAWTIVVIAISLLFERLFLLLLRHMQRRLEEVETV